MTTKRRSRQGLGALLLAPSRAARARRLCREVQGVHDLAAKATTCRRLVETLSEFGWESPEAKIRARACGCPVRR